MKKVFLAMMFASMMAFSANAQLFVGGSVGFDVSADKSTSGTTVTNGDLDVSFDFSPKVGYYLSSTFGVGVITRFGIGFSNDRESDPTKYTSIEWGFGPFMRYTVLSRGDFSLLVEGGTGVYGKALTRTIQSTTVKAPSTFGFDISAMPVLSYSLTSRVNLEASSNLLRFGFGLETTKSGAGDSLSKDTTTSFGFGINGYDFFSSPYRIGVIFKF